MELLDLHKMKKEQLSFSGAALWDRRDNNFAYYLTGPVNQCVEIRGGGWGDGGAPLIRPPDSHVIIRQWHGGLLSFSSEWRQRPAMSHSSSLLQIFHVRFVRTVLKRFSCEYTHAFSLLKGAKFKVHHPVFIITVCMQLFLFLIKVMQE